MAITIKRSTDSGAPALTNVAGTLIAIFDFMLVTALGWTKTSLGTNQVKYTWGSGTNGFCIQLDDSNAAFGKLSGWETLTALNTGTNQFPSAAQLSGGVFLDHAAAGSGTFPWRIVSDGHMVYFFVKYNIASNYIDTFVFGDFNSYKSSDIYNTIIIGNSAQALTSNPNFSQLGGSVSAIQTGHFIVRSYTQIGSSITAGKFSDAVRGSTTIGNGSMTYPSPIEGGLHLAPVWVNETIANAGPRGLLPGIWNVCHTYPLTDGDTFSVSSGPLSGRSFEIVSMPSAWQFAFETSNTWGGF